MDLGTGVRALGQHDSYVQVMLGLPPSPALCKIVVTIKTTAGVGEEVRREETVAGVTQWRVTARRRTMSQAIRAVIEAVVQVLRRVFIIPEWITLCLAFIGFWAEGVIVSAIAPELSKAATGSAAWLMERRIFGLYCVIAGGLVVTARAFATRGSRARFRVASIGGGLLIVLGFYLNIGVPLVVANPSTLPVVTLIYVSTLVAVIGLVVAANWP